ncbi:MAG: glycosyl transferase family 1 [Herbaspirillum sp.]|jgi:hypothetical protein|nr:glycosyl transferase family 1 [Herbaspirillum sp.]
MKKSIIGALFAASLLVAGVSTANAANINDTTAITFNTGTTSAGFSGAFGLGSTGKTFLENYTFSFPSTFDVTSAVISIALGATSAVNISSFTLTGNGQTFTGTETVSGSAVQVWNLTAANLASGAYTLSVLGNVLGSTGGSFGGNINISPVPEASTTAMMLGGLALVGFAATRRRRNNVAPLGMLPA